MITSATPSCCPSAHQATQQAFLGILPRLKLHGKVYFRDLKDPERREEAICEMLALAWSWFVRLAERGKDATQFASVLATYAARAVRAGRRLCGQERPRMCCPRWPSSGVASASARCPMVLALPAMFWTRHCRTTRSRR
jgi:hypothetical protein